MIMMVMMVTTTMAYDDDDDDAWQTMWCVMTSMVDRQASTALDTHQDSPSRRCSSAAYMVISSMGVCHFASLQVGMYAARQ